MEYSLYILIFALLVSLGAGGYFIYRYRTLAFSDEISGLPNYRGLRNYIKRAAKKNASFAIAIIDVDNFRQYNRIGYWYGDLVLQELVAFLKVNLPQNTFLARYKFGDEFVIVIHKPFSNSSSLIAELKAKCDACFFQINNIETKINFSYGVAELNSGKANIESLFSQAESALKQAKHTIV